MSKATSGTALTALAEALFGDRTSCNRHDQPASSSSSSGSFGHCAGMPAYDHATPPWAWTWSANNTGNGVQHTNRVARSLVEPEHMDQVANERAWAAFSSGPQVKVPRQVPIMSAVMSAPHRFDPWAIPDVPATTASEVTPTHDFDSVWDTFAADPARVRPVGSRIDDMADAVWESITGTPQGPWSWNADVNTARAMPVSAHEARVRADRGRARLAQLARQLVVTSGGGDAAPSGGCGTEQGDKIKAHGGKSGHGRRVDDEVGRSRGASLRRSEIGCG